MGQHAQKEPRDTRARQVIMTKVDCDGTWSQELSAHIADRPIVILTCATAFERQGRRIEGPLGVDTGIWPALEEAAQDADDLSDR